MRISKEYHDQIKARNDLIVCLYDAGESTGSIAAIAGIQRQSVRAALRKNGVAIRPMSIAAKLHRKPRRYKMRRHAPDRAKQIAKLLNRGVTYREAAIMLGLTGGAVAGLVSRWMR